MHFLEEGTPSREVRKSSISLDSSSSLKREPFNELEEELLEDELEDELEEQSSDSVDDGKLVWWRLKVT